MAMETVTVTVTPRDPVAAAESSGRAPPSKPAPPTLLDAHAERGRQGVVIATEDGCLVRIVRRRVVCVGPDRERSGDSGDTTGTMTRTATDRAARKVVGELKWAELPTDLLLAVARSPGFLGHRDLLRLENVCG